MTVGQCVRVIVGTAVLSLAFASPIFVNTHFHIPIFDDEAAAAPDYDNGAAAAAGE